MPKILAVEEVCASRLFRIESVHLQFSNGKECHFERIQGWAKGSVMVLPMLDDETVLLIREYGVGVEGYTLGFPKGAVHIDEDILETANRELQEEVGYKAAQLQEVMTFATSPGYLTASMQVVLARGLTESRMEGDEPEPLEVVPWRLAEVDALLANPEFVESRSIAAMLWLEREWRAKQIK